MTTLQERAEAAHNRLGVPALGVGRFDRDEAIEVAVTGVRHRGAGEPVTTEDPWHLGSCGKSITAALYGRLVELGRARWGASLIELGADLAGIDPGRGAVTTDDVLLHRARLPANLPRRALDAYQHDRRPPPQQRTGIANRTLAKTRRPHGRYRYSNLGDVLAGAAIERITTEPYEAALHTYLLDPLGITTARFGAPANVWGHSGRARTASTIIGRGRPIAPATPKADNSPVMSPAGRLCLTSRTGSASCASFSTAPTASSPQPPWSVCSKSTPAAVTPWAGPRPPPRPSIGRPTGLQRQLGHHRPPRPAPLPRRDRRHQRRRHPNPAPVRSHRRRAHHLTDQASWTHP